MTSWCKEQQPVKKNSRLASFHVRQKNTFPMLLKLRDREPAGTSNAQLAKRPKLPPPPGPLWPYWWGSAGRPRAQASLPVASDASRSPQQKVESPLQLPRQQSQGSDNSHSLQILAAWCCSLSPRIFSEFVRLLSVCLQPFPLHLSHPNPTSPWRTQSLRPSDRPISTSGNAPPKLRSSRR